MVLGEYHFSDSSCVVSLLQYRYQRVRVQCICFLNSLFQHIEGIIAPGGIVRGFLKSLFVLVNEGNRFIGHFDLSISTQAQIEIPFSAGGCPKSVLLGFHIDSNNCSRNLEFARLLGKRNTYRRRKGDKNNLSTGALNCGELRGDFGRRGGRSPDSNHFHSHFWESIFCNFYHWICPGGFFSD